MRRLSPALSPPTLPLIICMPGHHHFLPQATQPLLTELIQLLNLSLMSHHQQWNLRPPSGRLHLFHQLLPLLLRTPLPESCPLLSSWRGLWPLLLGMYTKKRASGGHSVPNPQCWILVNFGRYQMLKSTGSMTLLLGPVFISNLKSASQLLLTFLSP